MTLSTLRNRLTSLWAPVMVRLQRTVQQLRGEQREIVDRPYLTESLAR
jgi:hypothetical protein